jgi:homoserine O-succinyltransferase/O-acetyltransferase
MTLLFDKYRLIASPALAPTQPREAHEFDCSATAADRVLTIGLVNNMPDPALAATERQFVRLLNAASGNNLVHFHCFSLPSVPRSELTQRRVERQYTDIDDLGRLHIDGLIVTGAEPNAASLRDETFWRDLTGIIDWANANTRSTIWSCLAAHAAVLHLDGIERQRLAAKCSGVYDCAKAGSHWLTNKLPSPIRIPHSRLNGLRESDLTGRGYQLLTSSAEAGVDIFARQLQSNFIFFQGHPEYDTLSLQREYLRDILRYLAGERQDYPGIPAGYFDAATENSLAGFQARASVKRQPALMAELPDLRIRADVAAESAATQIFRNWLGYLADTARPPAPR